MGGVRRSHGQRRARARMHDVAPQGVCLCSRRHFATSSRVRGAPFSPRS